MTKSVNKKILLGMSGGIAAYKCAELVRRLKDQGCEVKVVMTDSAKHFITPLTMQAVRLFLIHYSTQQQKPQWVISNLPNGQTLF